MAETFNLANRIKLTNPSADVDEMYGTYDSVASACTAVIPALREKGRTVGILTSGSVVEYWWKSGILDSDLVEKTVDISGKAPINNPTFTNTVELAANPVGSSPNRLRQTMANSDYWEIYGDAEASDRGIMVIELGDNGGSSAGVGQRLEFRYAAGAGGSAKKPLIIDYNDITADTNLAAKTFKKIGAEPGNILLAGGGDIDPAQLGTSFTTDESLYLDPETKVLRLNTSGTSQYFRYTSGLKEFILADEPSKIFAGDITINGVGLTNPLTDFSIDVAAKKVTILAPIPPNSDINIKYQFIITK